VAVSIVATEALVFLLLPWQASPVPELDAILHAGLLVVVVSPALYFFIYRPMVQILAERERHVRYLGVQYAAASVLAQAGSLREAATQLLRTICEGLGWDRSELWEVDPRGEILRMTSAWSTPALDFSGFEAISRETTFSAGLGLPGRAWRSREPAWIADVTRDSNFPRAAAAAGAGLHSAFAFPFQLTVTGDGVMTFFGRKIQERDDELLEMLAHLSSQLGQFAMRKRAEEALPASEGKYRELVTQINDGVYASDQRGVLTFANLALARMLGFEHVEQVVGRNFAEFVAPSALHKLATYFTQALEGGQTRDLVVAEVVHPGGEHAFLEIKSGASMENGVVVGLRGVLRDITERMRAEEALQLQGAALDAAANAIVITARDGTIEWVNPAFTVLSGYSAEEALGKNPRDLVRSDRQDPAFYKQLWATILAGKVWHGELINRRKDGSLYTEEQTITPLTERGEISHFISIKQNVSERAQAREALRQSEARHRTLVESAPDGIVVTSADGTVQSVNAAAERLLGWARGELLGRSYLGYLHPDDVAEAGEVYRLALAGEAVAPSEWRLRHRSGDSITVEVTTVPLLQDGQVSGLLSLVRDIGERKQRERVQHAVSALSETLRAASTQREMLPLVLDQSLALLDAQLALLTMRDPATGETLFEAGRGAVAQPFIGRRLAPGEGIGGHVIATGEPYVSNDVHVDPRFTLSDVLSAEVRALVCVPLRAHAQTIGALWLGRGAAFTHADVLVSTTIADLVASAIHRAGLHEQTEARLRRLSALRAIDMAITSSLDLRVTLNVILDQVTMLLDIDAAEILLMNSHTQWLELAATRGFRTAEVRRAPVRLGEGPAGRAALERRTIILPDLNEDEPGTNAAEAGPARAAQHAARRRWLAAEGIVAYNAVPLVAKGLVNGVLETYHRTAFEPDQEWLDFLETLAGQAAIAIENAALFDSVYRSNAELGLAYDATIEGWSRALDLRDRETEGHSQRVTELTLTLARALGMSDAESVHVRRGALLHDIGKMGVPDAILLKPGPLTDDEWRVMRLHPEMAYTLLSPIVYLRPALDIPYCHHEKWDGTGYPRALKGEQIPLAARLFAVVDVWDALRSDRPYRKAWTEEKAREHITAQAGTHFDPRVVERFLHMLDEA
jgi:PAS domain S-box-containing protein